MPLSEVFDSKNNEGLVSRKEVCISKQKITFYKILSVTIILFVLLLDTNNFTERERKKEETKVEKKNS